MLNTNQNFKFRLRQYLNLFGSSDVKYFIKIGRADAENSRLHGSIIEWMPLTSVISGHTSKLEIRASSRPESCLVLAVFKKS